MRDGVSDKSGGAFYFFYDNIAEIDGGGVYLETRKGDVMLLGIFFIGGMVKKFEELEKAGFENPAFSLHIRSITKS